MPRHALLLLLLPAVVTTTSPNPTSASPAGHGLRRCPHDLDAARAVPERIQAAWGANDAAAFARIWTHDGDLIVGDGTYLTERDAIHRYMRDNYAGPAAGTRVTAIVTDARCISPTVAVIHTHGGVLLPGETDVPPERRGIQTFIVIPHGADWHVAAYQNTRITPT